MPENPPGFLPPGGNYRELLSYRKSEIIYDFTFRFCGSFLKKWDRTVDQMVQAARSGKQNIAEGSKASATSTETEIKLISARNTGTRPASNSAGKTSSTSVSIPSPPARSTMIRCRRTARKRRAEIRRTRTQ